MELMHTTITTWLGMCLSHSSPTLPNWSSTKPATVLCGIGDPTVRSFTNLSRTKGSGETLMTSIWDFIPQWPGSQHSMFFHKKKMFKHVQKMMHSRKVLGVVFNHNFDYQKGKYQGINQKGIFGIRNKFFLPRCCGRLAWDLQGGLGSWVAPERSCFQIP